MVKPFKISALKGIQNILIKQLSDIVDILAQKHTHAHLNRNVFLLSFRKFRRSSVGQVLERVLVVVLLIISSPVVEGEGEEEFAENLGVCVRELFYVFFYSF